MATEILYKSLNGQILTPQQIAQIDEYAKYIFINNATKMIERSYKIRRDPGIAKRISYFLDDATENRNLVAAQLCNPLENTSCSIRYNKQTINGFILWDCQYYNINGQAIGGLGQEVYDSQGRLIYESDFSEETGLLMTVRKIMYANQSSNEIEDILLVFRFSFNAENGQMELDILDRNNRFYWLMPKDLDITFLMDEGLWDSHPYYHTHLPVVPESPVV